MGLESVEEGCVPPVIGFAYASSMAILYHLSFTLVRSLVAYLHLVFIRVEHADSVKRAYVL
jgi:hypothetical protein